MANAAQLLASETGDTEGQTYTLLQQNFSACWGRVGRFLIRKIWALRILFFEREFVDRTPTHKTHLCSTVCSQAVRTAQLMRLAQELHCHLCAPQNKCCHLVWQMSHPWLSSHAPSFMSTSSSSPSCSTTQREHSVHPAHLRAPSVDKLRHQESLWCEDLQSGGNPRTTTLTEFGLCRCPCSIG